MDPTVCRSCGTAVPADATACPECGTTDPLASAARETTHVRTPGPAEAGGADRLGAPSDPAPVEPARTGSPLKRAAKAIGCLVIAGIVLLIALMIGLLDFIF